MLGGGLSGEVWQAHDTQTGEEVAYKLVAPQALPTSSAVERAGRELKQLMRSQNPRIAKVIDTGKVADGRMFVVTELVGAAEPLDALVARSGPLPLERAKKIVAQIGEALLEGQKVGVVHHDLSAKNVLINAQDEIKVINFVTPRPVSETVFGVPEYLSPEQAEGKLVDQRSNTYSLGAIMTVVLTGAPPFSGATAKEVLDQLLHGQATPPSQRRPDLTPEIDRVIMKALEKSSSRRPLTMRQYLNDVASLSTGAGAAVASFGAGRPAGSSLAKTMMFAGGAPEVQKMIADATAARAEANGSAAVAGFINPAAAVVAPAPVPAPAAMAAAPEPAPHRAPNLQRSHGAAVAATMVALPAAPYAAAPGPQTTPAPVAAGQPLDESGGRKPAAGQGANFRETLWFKKGDVDQMVADAKAKAAGASASRGRPAPATPVELPVDDSKPLEDRYVDDGSVTVEDRKKFSLRSGGTAAGLPTVGAGMPGERMSETEMLNEIGGGKKTLIIVITVGVLAALAAVWFVAFRGKGAAKIAIPAPALTKAAEAPPPPPVPPSPPAAAAAATAPEAPAAEAADEPEPPHIKEPTAKARAAHKKGAAKKNAKKKR